MKSIFAYSVTAAILGLAAAGPAAIRDACNADNCARAVTGTRFPLPEQSAHLADCSSFLSYTMVLANKTVTTTITPSVTAFYNDYITVSRTTVTNATVWPTTIESEVYLADKRAAAGTAPFVVSTISPSVLPTYASACSASARYSSACSCAGVKPRYTMVGGSTVQETVYAPTTATITHVNTFYETATIGVTETLTTPRVDKIPCGLTVQPSNQDGSSPTFQVVCEAEHAGDKGFLIETIYNTTFADCIAYAPTYIYDYEFDLNTNTCYAYRGGSDRTQTQPRARYVYAYRL